MGGTARPRLRGRRLVPFYRTSRQKGPREVVLSAKWARCRTAGFRPRPLVPHLWTATRHWGESWRRLSREPWPAAHARIVSDGPEEVRAGSSTCLHQGHQGAAAVWKGAGTRPDHGPGSTRAGGVPISMGCTVAPQRSPCVGLAWARRPCAAPAYGSPPCDLERRTTLRARGGPSVRTHEVRRAQDPFGAPCGVHPSPSSAQATDHPHGDRVCGGAWTSTRCNRAPSDESTSRGTPPVRGTRIRRCNAGLSGTILREEDMR
jgi:hypothetical protein